MKFSQKEIINVANLLSFSRIPLAVLIVIFYETKWLVFSLLIVAILTDAADGYIARKHSPTKIGAVIDAFCDKVMVGIILLFFLFLGVINLEGLALLLLRDVFIIFLSLFLLLRQRGRVFSFAKSRWSGKVVTIAQFVTIVTLLLSPAHVNYLIYVVAALSLIAIVDYFIAVKKSL